MKFIRDIINEKKLASEAENLPVQDPSPDPAEAQIDDQLDDADLPEFGKLASDPFARLAQDKAPSETLALEPEAEEPETDTGERAEDFQMGPPAEPDPIDAAILECLADPADLSAPEHAEPQEIADHDEAKPEHADPSTDRQDDPMPLRRPFMVAPEPSGDDPDIALQAQESAEAAAPEPAVIPVEVPKPAAGRTANRSGRVKTRLLGFSTPDMKTQDPLGQSSAAGSPGFSNFPVGWLVVTDGPGRGAAFTLFEGLTQIGRGEGQAVRLNFGDNSISRENHAAIAFDAEQRKFYFGHGGKANLVRLNGRPVLSTEDLPSESQIRIGETTLRFIALCGEAFSWSADQQKVAVNDVHG